jgi:hypothetical protein
VPLVRIAALADWVRAACSHFEPLRVLPDLRFPPDSLLPGQTPAQEARWRWLGKTDMSRPISASSASAVRLSTPGIVSTGSRASVLLRVSGIPVQARAGPDVGTS